MERIKDFIDRRKLPVFLAIVVILAVILVIISVAIYYKSGAYQLDLSRPEYKGVRSQIEPDRRDKDPFNTQGQVDAEVIDDFLLRYQEEVDKALKADAYSADVLSPDQLGI